MLGHRVPGDEKVKLKFISELIQIASLRFIEALKGSKITIVVLVNEEVIRSEDIESSQLANIESSESSQLSMTSQLS